MSETLPKIFSEKRHSMYITKKCRFLESERLSIKNKISLIIRTSLAILMTVISIAIYGKGIDINIKSQTIITISSSITLLVLSFYDSSANRQGRSEKFHKNGMEISAILTKYEIESQRAKINREKCRDIILEYENFIKSSDLNHCSATYRLVISEEDRTSRQHSISSRIYYIFTSFVDYLISMIAYIVPFLLIIFFEVLIMYNVFNPLHCP